MTNITYDADGQRTGMTDGTGTSAWAWDSLHRLTSYTNGNGAQVRYAYNLRNLPTTITYPGALNVTRGYDDAGLFTSVADWLSNTTTFGYDPNSNLTAETLPADMGIVDSFTARSVPGTVLTKIASPLMRFVQRGITSKAVRRLTSSASSQTRTLPINSHRRDSSRPSLGTLQDACACQS